MESKRKSMLTMQGSGSTKQERQNQDRKIIPKYGTHDVKNMVKADIAMMGVVNN
jgi:hypothetical protein